MNRVSKTFTVLGIMSGSSLDGVDLAACRFDMHNGRIKDWQIVASHTFPFEGNWKAILSDVPAYAGLELIKTDRAFGSWLGSLAAEFLQTHNLRVDLIASHGHTVFHMPPALSLQIGHGAPLSAATGLPVVTDLRSMDVAFGGEGAPLAPLVDVHLFPEYNAWLNLGGIANTTVRTTDREIAMDIVPCNQLLNTLAGQKGLAFDGDGKLAAVGKPLPVLMDKLNDWSFLKKAYPRSLGNEEVKNTLLPLINRFEGAVEDKLHTLVHWISEHIAQSLSVFFKEEDPNTKIQILCTGGGVWNKYLMTQIIEKGRKTGVNYHWNIPNPEIVNFKECLLVALFGLFRYLNTSNTRSDWTGAQQSSTGGAIYWNTK